MVKKLIFVTIISVVSLCASQSIEYKSDKVGSLSEFFSCEGLKIINDFVVTLDLSSALAIVDTRFVIDDFKNAPKRIHNDTSLVTLSYKF